MLVLAIAVSSDKLKYKFLTLNQKIKVIKCNFHNGIIRWQISKSIQVVLCIFALALTVSEILNFFYFLPSKIVGQGHGVQSSQ